MRPKLYEHPLSPYVRKVKIVLYQKGIDFERVSITPMTLRVDDAVYAEFAGASPRLEVPCLLDGEFRCSDSTIIVDYPNATFGVNSLAPGKSFPYVIKPMGTGPLKVQFTNAQGVSHSVNGPAVHKGDEGAIQIKLSQDSAAFF